MPDTLTTDNYVRDMGGAEIDRVLFGFSVERERRVSPMRRGVWYEDKGDYIRCLICHKMCTEAMLYKKATWRQYHRAWHLSRLNPEKVSAALAVMALNTESGPVTTETAVMAVHQVFSRQEILLARTWTPGEHPL